VDEGVVLVTGGSRGIGRALVERLAARGGRVAFTFHSGEAEAHALEAALGPAVRAFPMDLLDRAAPARVVEAAEAALGPVLGLVNNAAVRREALVGFCSDAEWDAVIDANLGGSFRCARAVLRGMIAARRGAIVNVASLSAYRGVAGQAAYAASKAGLLALTRCLARELGRSGIRVNAVVPGLVDTAMTADLTDARRSQLRADQCLRAPVPPAGVAGVIAFLLSDDAAHVTGQEVVVDAGTSA